MIQLSLIKTSNQEKTVLPAPKVLFDENFEIIDDDTMLKPLNESIHNFSHLAADGGTSEQLSRSVGCIGSGSKANGETRNFIKSLIKLHLIPCTETQKSVSYLYYITFLMAKTSEERVIIRRKNRINLFQVYTHGKNFPLKSRSTAFFF